MSGPGVMARTTEASANARMVAMTGTKLSMRRSLHAAGGLNREDRNFRPSGAAGAWSHEQRHQENRPLLLWRARHLDHAQMAAGALPGRNRDLHGRPRAGRRARAGAP